MIPNIVQWISANRTNLIYTAFLIIGIFVGMYLQQQFHPSARTPCCPYFPPPTMAGQPAASGKAVQFSEPIATYCEDKTADCASQPHELVLEAEDTPEVATPKASAISATAAEIAEGQ